MSGGLPASLGPAETGWAANLALPDVLGVIVAKRRVYTSCEGGRAWPDVIQRARSFQSSHLICLCRRPIRSLRHPTKSAAALRCSFSARADAALSYFLRSDDADRPRRPSRCRGYP